MSIFKRDQESPFNRAAATKAPAGTVSPTGGLSSGTTPASPAAPRDAAPIGGLGAGGAAPATSSPAAPVTVAQPVARDAAAVIDQKTEITGTLHSSGNVLIEGRFHGEVEAKDTVWIEKGAQSDGQLLASEAVISGSVDGQIDCGRRLQIAATAVVSGEIKTPILVIEEGATVNCRFSMMRSGSTAPNASGGM